MKTIIAETQSNFNRFSATWPEKLEGSRAALMPDSKCFLASYRRITTMQAWRTSIVEQNVTSESLSFFLEAQNDLLLSHVLAQNGLWRSALASLRSAIENVLTCLYYTDHPVEHIRWNQGNHRLSFSELEKYFVSHPMLSGIDQTLTGMEILHKEFTTLSKAVHASSLAFRMTKFSVVPIVTNHLPKNFGGWKTREGLVVHGLNLFLLSFFHESLQGAALPNLRKSISLVIPETMHQKLRDQLHIRLFPMDVSE